jgi:crossover junction endodeoxyribonuclease RuvC
VSLRILGIDPGSRTTGYGVVDADGSALRCVECGVVAVAASLPLELRLAEILKGLLEVAEELRPQVAAVEDVFHAINARSALALGQARGVALAAAALAGIRVHAYPPSVVKQAVTGRGRATKEQVGRMVRLLVGLRREPRADAADALAVAIAHANRTRRRA